MVKHRKAVIIFSRYNSIRLPGKALKRINGRELLGRVIDRARLVDADMPVIVATSTESTDDRIAKFSEMNGVSCYRGDLCNVLKRAIDTCKKFDVDVFARICGDRPFFSPELTLAGFHQFDDNLDLLSSQPNLSLPPGLTTEIVKVSALEKVIRTTTKKEDLEHFTRFIYKNSSMFRIKTFNLSEPIKGWTRLVIDNEKDLRKARWIAEFFSSAKLANTPYTEIIRYAVEYDNSF
ncbi:hypothetical protein N9X39_03735 [Alphaproteobacteria bacterium]|nr:hypothetical protein [Alphaproteobacteria bacterium]